MKHLALILFLASALSAQIFSPPGKVRRYAGTPTAGDCNANSLDRLASNTTAIPTEYYSCKQTSAGVYGWVLISDAVATGDITAVNAGTGLTGGATSGAATLSLATITASRLMVTDGSGYPSASAVTSTEAGYLSGVTSAIQTQLNARLAAASNLSDLANASTARTNLGVAIGTNVQAWDADLDTIGGLAKTDDNILVANGSTWQLKALPDCSNATTSKVLYDIASNAFSCGTDQTGGAGSGTFQATITDLKPTRSTVSNANDTLNIAGGRCWGATKSAANAKITAGNGTGSYVAYCTDTQTIVVEHSTSAGLTVTCTNCTHVQVAVPSVPEGLAPIASGTISSGASVAQWSDPTDTRDIYVGGLRIVNGVGMSGAYAGGVYTPSVDTAVVQTKDSNYTPVARLDATGATSSAPNKAGTSAPGTCIVGDTFFDTDASAGSNMLLCTSTNTWTAIGGSSTATHTQIIPIGTCNNSDGVLANSWWSEPRSGTTSAAAAGCDSMTEVSAPHRTFTHNTANTYMYLTVPLATNRTGAFDLHLYGFSTAGSGVVKMDIAKGCIVDGVGSTTAYTFSDAQSAQYTVGASPNVTTLSYTNMTIPAACTGYGMVIRVTRDIGVGSNAGAQFFLRGARIVYRTN